jgi:hypothetical protein
MAVRNPVALAARTALTSLLAAGAVLTPVGAAGAAPAPGGPGGTASHRARVSADFDGDGRQDVVVGAPPATVSGVRRAGYVVVVYGSKHGPDTGRHQVISRATKGVAGSPTSTDYFGERMTTGDLDGDGYTDLVVGDLRSYSTVVLWGGPKGLSTPTTLTGWNLATAADFTGDGRTDLMLFHAGRHIEDDPAGTTAQLWTGPISRSLKPAKATAWKEPAFGGWDVWEPVAGDLTGDGRADLVVDFFTGDGGFSTELFTSTGGGAVPLRYAGHPFPDTQDVATSGLAIGDVNGDGRADLVARPADGEPRLTVAYGAPAGLVPDDEWTEVAPGDGRLPDADAFFGTAVAVADTDGDDHADVAFFAEDAGARNGGAVLVLHGSRNGLSAARAEEFTQSTLGVPGVAEPGDCFGDALRFLDADGDHHPDLLVGNPCENGGSGSVWRLPGSAHGLTGTGSTAFSAGAVGAKAVAKDGFGSSLG